MAKAPAQQLHDRVEEMRATLERIERKIDLVLERLDGIEDTLSEAPEPEAEPRREPGTQVH